MVESIVSDISFITSYLKNLNCVKGNKYPLLRFPLLSILALLQVVLHSVTARDLFQTFPVTYCLNINFE